MAATQHPANSSWVACPGRPAARNSGSTSACSVPSPMSWSWRIRLHRSVYSMEALRRLVHLHRWPVSPVLKNPNRMNRFVSFFLRDPRNVFLKSIYIYREICSGGQATEFVEFLLSISSSIGQIVRIGVIGRAEGKKKIRDPGWDGRA